MCNSDVSCEKILWMYASKCVIKEQDKRLIRDIHVYSLYSADELKKPVLYGATRGQEILSFGELQCVCVWPASIMFLCPPLQALNPKAWLHSGTSWPNGWARRRGPRSPCRTRYMNWTERSVGTTSTTKPQWGETHCCVSLKDDHCLCIIFAPMVLF